MRLPSFRAAFVGAAFGLTVAGLVVASSPSAEAKSAYESTYGFERTWNAGLRLVRVDLGLKVSEKDEGIGYVLFDYKSPESSKPVPGSMEFIRAESGGPVRVVVQIPQMPGYHEQVLVDALAKKLRVEYGEAPRIAPPSRAKDAGTPKSDPEDGGT